ncbi:MAG: 4-alpha-glucanotransferase [Lachnospiraceae bacterium]|nr:4-alpha-glucanotransferase [Lachnospiraceae bacterium]
MRKSGILLAISSLPGRYGIGTFSKNAYAFVDFLDRAGQSLWQILPLGPTGYGDSPYQSFSTFAGNPYYIDLDEFIDKGWLTEKDCEAYDYGASGSVDYELIYKAKFALLKKAYKKSDISKDKEFMAFKKENAFWLDDYALYMSVKDEHLGGAWTTWDESLKLRKKSALDKYRKKLADEIECYCFQQYYFYRQWKALKAYANEKGIQIVGDIPIYVAMDSSDTWSHPELFDLDENCDPVNVAGCPPDAFTALGQLWGNPLYKWDYHKETGYEWWMTRMEHCFKLYDIVRIDHFRGFDEYYAIPYGSENAIVGEWLPGPGLDLFKCMKERLGKKQVIAEDLGFLTDSVIKMVKRSGFPGMKVLQFAFDSREESDYLPHNYERNCVVYTGTHDNDTTRHWFDTLARGDRSFAKRYLDIKTSKDAVNKMLRAGLGSVADTCIVPMQDYLGLGGDARMNFPSTLGNNWKWRLEKNMMSESTAEEIYKLCKLYGRAKRRL